MPGSFLWLPATAVTADQKFFAQPRPSTFKATGLESLFIAPGVLMTGSVVAAKFRGTLIRPQSASEEMTVAGPGPVAGTADKPGVANIGKNTGLPHATGCIFEFDAYCKPSSGMGPLWYRIAPSSLPRTAGWSSDTGFRTAKTAVQSNVMELLRPWTPWLDGAEIEEKLGEASDQSVYENFKGAPPCWETDVKNGDSFDAAKQLIALLVAIDAWYKAAPAPKPTTATSVMPAQQEAFRAKVPFWAPVPPPPDKKSDPPGRDDRPLLVLQAIDCYLRKRGSVPIPEPNFPLGANEVLAYYEFRADCRETADIIVLKAGGSFKSYIQAAAAGVLSIDVRPGMYVFYSSTATGALSHTMLLSDAYWDASGQLKKLRVAESNKGGGWGHPTGMIPWKRRRWRDRPVTVNTPEANLRMYDPNARKYYLVVNSGPA